MGGAQHLLSEGTVYDEVEEGHWECYIKVTVPQNNFIPKNGHFRNESDSQK